MPILNSQRHFNIRLRCIHLTTLRNERQRDKRKKKQTTSTQFNRMVEKKCMYHELGKAIEPRYLHIPIECNVLANRDDKEILFLFLFSCCCFFSNFFLFGHCS